MPAPCELSASPGGAASLIDLSCWPAASSSNSISTALSASLVTPCGIFLGDVVFPIDFALPLPCFAGLATIVCGLRAMVRHSLQVFVNWPQLEQPAVGSSDG